MVYFLKNLKQNKYIKRIIHFFFLCILGFLLLFLFKIAVQILFPLYIFNVKLKNVIKYKDYSIVYRDNLKINFSPYILFNNITSIEDKKYRFEAEFVSVKLKSLTEIEIKNPKFSFENIKIENIQSKYSSNSNSLFLLIKIFNKEAILSSFTSNILYNNDKEFKFNLMEFKFFLDKEIKDSNEIFILADLRYKHQLNKPLVLKLDMNSKKSKIKIRELHINTTDIFVITKGDIVLDENQLNNSILDLNIFINDTKDLKSYFTEYLKSYVNAIQSAKEASLIQSLSTKVNKRFLNFFDKKITDLIFRKLKEKEEPHNQSTEQSLHINLKIKNKEMEINSVKQRDITISILELLGLKSSNII